MRHAGSLYSRTRPGHFTGKVRLMAIGSAKRDYVASLNVNRYAEIHAFGDTSSDAPLFDVAHHSTLVDPSAHTESVFAGRAAMSIIRD
jgi:phosphoserine phosphatase